MNSSSKYTGIAYLLAVAILIPLLASRFALADTVSKWRETKCTERELVDMRIQTVTSPSALDVAINKTEHICDGELLGEILCGPGCCEVVKYVPYSATGTEGFTLYTAEIVLNTDYLSLVRIVDNIERTMPGSRLRSVSMRSITPRGSARPQLHANLIIQQITESQ